MVPTSHGEMAEFYDNMTKEFVERCTICGECLEACPLFPLTKFADRGPQAVMEKMMQLLQGGEVSEEAYDMIVSCTWGRLIQSTLSSQVQSVAYHSGVNTMSPNQSPLRSLSSVCFSLHSHHRTQP